MIFCSVFLLKIYAKSNSNDGSLYSLQISSSQKLPNSRISNYSIGENGNIAIAFRGKEIMIYNSNGEFVNHIIVKNSEHFFIDYREGSENIDVFFARNHTAILISEKGNVLEEYEYLENEIETRRSASNKSTKMAEKFTYKMKSSFNFPITTCSTKLIQINNLTGEEKVILNNPLVSIVESVSLVCIILVYGGILLMMSFKILRYCIRHIFR